MKYAVDVVLIRKHINYCLLTVVNCDLDFVCFFFNTKENLRFFSNELIEQNLKNASNLILKYKTIALTYLDNK